MPVFEFFSLVTSFPSPPEYPSSPNFSQPQNNYRGEFTALSQGIKDKSSTILKVQS